MPRREKLNEAYLVKRVAETKGRTRKMSWPGVRGAPDRFVGWPTLGKFALVEVKEEQQPWGLQPHQAREIQFLLACGLPAVVLDNKQQIDYFVKQMTGL